MAEGPTPSKENNKVRKEYNMPLPAAITKSVAPTTTATAPVTAAATNAVETSAPEASADKKVSHIKQFASVKDEAGNLIPVPRPLGVDLVEFAKETYAFVNDKAKALGAELAELVEAADSLDKETIPGSKEGKITYGFANILVKLSDIYDATQRKRGAGGFAAIKAREAAKDAKIEQLQKQLEALMAQLNGAK
jgi:hypothetical protein